MHSLPSGSTLSREAFLRIGDNDSTLFGITEVAIFFIKKKKKEL